MTKRSRKWPRAVRDRLRSLLPSLAPARVKLARYGQAFLTVMNDHDGGAGDDLRQDDALPPSPLPPSANDERLAAIRQHHGRAYEKWTQAEDTDLLSLHAAGTPLSELATHFRRQPSAISARLAKLSPESDPETS